MTIRASTGLKNAMLGTVGLQGATADGVLRIYSGSQPASADAAVIGTLLMEVTLDGGAFAHGSPTNGLNWDTPSAGTISKPVADTWKGAGLTNGVAGWARYCSNPLDTGASSTTLARIDMSVGSGTGDLQLSSVNIATSAPTTVDVATLRLP
jgi:hypothetical protein